MGFYEIVDQVIALLRSRGRLSYRALTVEFKLTDKSLAALKDELIEAQELAVDKDGKMLVWVGEGAASVLRPTFPVSSSQSLTPNSRWSIPLPTSLSAFVPNRQLLKLAASLMVNVRPSLPCSPISKARRR